MGNNKIGRAARFHEWNNAEFSVGSTVLEKNKKKKPWVGCGHSLRY
jgi:hypothetical protein